MMRNLVLGEKGSRSLQSRLTRVLDHEIDALIYFLLFFRGPYCFTVFRACSESFSPPPNKMILGIFEYAVLLLYAIIFIYVLMTHAIYDLDILLMDEILHHLGWLKPYK